MENHKVNSNEKLLNEADFMLAIMQTYKDIAYLEVNHSVLYNGMQSYIDNKLKQLESFIKNDKIDWEQLYEICLSEKFSASQIQTVKSLIGETIKKNDIQDKAELYRDLYKSFRYLKGISVKLYDDVISNINTNYNLSCDVDSIGRYGDNDTLHRYFFECRNIVEDFLRRLSIPNIPEKLGECLCKAVLFYYIIDQEFFSKGKKFSEILKFMEDKQKFKNLQAINPVMVKFIAKTSDEDITFLSSVVVEQLKDVCFSYVPRKIGMSVEEKNFWGELTCESGFWSDNEKYNDSRLVNGFLRNVIQTFIDCGIHVVESSSTLFRLKTIPNDSTEPIFVQLKKELAAYAYDLIALIMPNAELGDEYVFLNTYGPETAKTKYVKNRLKSATQNTENNEDCVTMEFDGYNGFKLIANNYWKGKREFYFSLPLS